MPEYNYLPFQIALVSILCIPLAFLIFTLAWWDGFKWDPNKHGNWSQIIAAAAALTTSTLAFYAIFLSSVSQEYFSQMKDKYEFLAARAYLSEWRWSNSSEIWSSNDRTLSQYEQELDIWDRFQQKVRKRADDAPLGIRKAAARVVDILREECAPRYEDSLALPVQSMNSPSSPSISQPSAANPVIPPPVDQTTAGQQQILNIPNLLQQSDTAIRPSISERVRNRSVDCLTRLQDRPH